MVSFLVHFSLNTGHGVLATRSSPPSFSQQLSAKWGAKGANSKTKERAADRRAAIRSGQASSASLLRNSAARARSSLPPHRSSQRFGSLSHNTKEMRRCCVSKARRSATPHLPGGVERRLAERGREHCDRRWAARRGASLAQALAVALPRDGDGLVERRSDPAGPG